MFKVELTEKAAADVELVMKWFHDHQATSAGRKWHETLSTALEKLERHPQRVRSRRNRKFLVKKSENC